MAASSLAGLDGSTSMHNVHLDVLSATPETEESRIALVEELKRRARGSIGCKNYAEAEVLYSKAIEVVTMANTTSSTATAVDPTNAPSSTSTSAWSSSSSELAILHTNRSLCKYYMGKFESSVHDARQATLLDNSYVKAHWRLGQGLSQQQHYAEALAAFQQAVQLEPSNKALQKELQTTEQQLQRLQQPTTTSTATTNTTASNTTKSKPRKTSHTDKAREEEDEEILFTQSESIRGYKVIDGKKTSYFHREISEEERRLIGDIAPKKLQDETLASATCATIATSAVVEGTSVWNTAGTWEEKDVTQWAIDTLRAALLATRYTLPTSVTTTTSSMATTPLCASVTKVKNLSGHASVATVRGKRRYIYEFAITLEWKLPLQDSTESICTGTLTFPDVDGSCGGVYDISDYTVHSDTPPQARHLLDKYIKWEGLRDEITKTLNNWIKLFQDTYSI
jgi:tetratricopeptide (TPR) repeat protein